MAKSCLVETLIQWFNTHAADVSSHGVHDADLTLACNVSHSYFPSLLQKHWHSPLPFTVKKT